MTADRQERQTSDHENPPTAPPKKKALRAILLVLIALVLVLAGLVVYIQTPLGFRQVILPIAAGQVDGALSVGSGRVSLGGSVRMEKIRFAADDGSLEFEADEMFADAAPFSFFGDAIHVREVRVIRPVAVLDVAKEPAHNDDEKEENKKPESNHGGGNSEFELPIPLIVDRVVVEGLAVRQMRGEAVELALEKGELTLDNFGPGKKAALNFAVDFAASPNDPDRRQTGAMQFDLAIDQPNAGREVAWTGEGRLDIRETAVASGAMQFDLDLEGRLDDAPSAANKLTVEARQETRALGTIATDVDWSGADPKPSMNVAVRFKAINEGFLNPFLAMQGPARLDNADIEGAFDVATEGENCVFSGDLKADDMKLRPAPDQNATPPLRLTLAYAGRMPRDASELTLEKVDVSVAQSGRPIVAAKLNETMTLALAESDRASGDEGAEANLTVTLDEIRVRDLRPWMAVAGSAALDSVEDGELSGQYVVSLTPDGQELRVDGNATLDDLRIAQPEDGSLGPFRIAHTLQTRVENMESVAVESAATRVELDGRPLAEVKVAGTYHLESLATDFSLDVTADDLVGSAEKLGVVIEGPVTVEGGNLKSAYKVKRESAEGGYLVAESTDLRDLRLHSETAGTLTRNIAIRNTVRTDPEMTEVEIEGTEIALTDGEGNNAGRITMEGRWPISPSPESQPRAGKLLVKSTGFDAAPWLALMGVAAPGQFETISVQSEATIEGDAAGRTFTVEGWKKFGPLETAPGDPQSETIFVTNEGHFEFSAGDPDAEKATPKLQIHRLTFATEGRAQPDRMEITGAATLGERPNIELAVNVERFDANFIARRLTTSETESASTKEEKEKDEPKAPGGEPAEKFEGIPVDLDIEINVGQAIWRELEIADAKAKIVGQDGALDATLEPMQLAGGTLGGEAHVKPVESGAMDLQWSASGEAIDVDTLIAAAAPEKKGSLEGTAAFTTEGSAQAPPDEIARSLDGTLVFDLTDGKLGESRLLNFIVERTGIEEFREILFILFHGDIRLQEGWANLRDVRVTGKEVQLLADGRASLDGRLDVGIVPRVGERLTDKFKEKQYLSALLVGEDGYATLPLRITVKGTAEEPKFGATLKAPDLKESLEGAVKGLLDDLAGKDEEEEEEKEGAAPTPTPSASEEPAEKEAESPDEKPATEKSAEEILRDKVEEGLRGLFDR